MCNYCFNSLQKGATAFTAAKNKEIANKLHLDQSFCVNREYDLADSRCIYPVDDLEIMREDGRAAWTLKKYAFLKEDAAADSVNPSLWINGKSNRLAGVFEVVKGAIYQVRGFDLANLTIIRSKSGWIVQDVMTNVEASRAALELLEKALGEPVKDKIRAVIISHSHVDHFGGIRGVVSGEQVGSGEEGLIPIIVPAGFDVESVKENVMAGPAMIRRSAYQGGRNIEPGVFGAVSTGIGLWGSKGTISYLLPTDYIDRDLTRVIDGITIEFQLTPGTEAPAEMNNYYADYRALWMAENCSGTLHNLYPIRGTQIRDGAAWSNYILEAKERFASRSDVVFQAHNWPHFNTKEEPDAVGEFLLGTAAVYKYIHDQTLLAANKGRTAKEIARDIDIPEGLSENWYTRPYYGSPKINARAVFTKYLGFYNGLPTDLDPLTEREDAALFVEYAGGADAVLVRAVKDFEAGEYLKTANAASRVVLADPLNEKARQLTADAYEQLAYVSESGIWRNAYLQGAWEMRIGEEAYRKAQYHDTRDEDLVAAMSADLLLTYAGILLDYDRIQEENFSFALTITDGNGSRTDHDPITYDVRIYAGILLPVRSELPESADYVRLSRKAFLAWIHQDLESVREEVESNIYEKFARIGKAFSDFTLGEK